MATSDSLWAYTPSLPAAAVACVTFAILTIFHLIKLFKTRAYFCVPFVVGGVFETVGFAARGVGKSNMDSLTPYIMQALLILLAPILFAASVYMLLSRLIRAANAEKYSIVPIKWLTKTFVGGDILSFTVQGAGASILSNADTAETRDIGEYVVLAGLIIQIIIFVFFLIVAMVFDKRLRAYPTRKSENVTFNLRRFINMLYIVSFLITFRNLFRVIEYAMGEDGYLLANEWPLYVFDALPMAAVLVICGTWYIGNFSREGNDTIINLSSQETEH